MLLLVCRYIYLHLAKININHSLEDGRYTRIQRVCGCLQSEARHTDKLILTDTIHQLMRSIYAKAHTVSEHQFTYSLLLSECLHTYLHRHNSGRVDLSFCATPGNPDPPIGCFTSWVSTPGPSYPLAALLCR